MKNAFSVCLILPSLYFLLLSVGCHKQADNMVSAVKIEAESYVDSFGDFALSEFDGNKVITALDKSEWLAYDVNVEVPGRYRCEINLSSESNTSGSCWIEDYYDNQDGRTYNITAGIPVPATRKGGKYSITSKEGCPLNTGLHKMKLHFESDSVNVDWIIFTLIKPHRITPDTFVQNMAGDKWELVWSDEFEGQGLPDTNKWAYDIGNWGWGNNEPQYYTEYRTENARQENGNLVIEARKNDLGQPWTSARLTTRGKENFLYGKIEFRAMPPAGIGTWAACWFLGDAYRDELSWPYCGEIDVMECVGREVNQGTGDGINHASCHTRAYYFKQGNHLTSTIQVKNMTNEFHLYSIEWSPDGIHAYLDGQKYYTYDKLNGEREWPFNNPQNIILNLAMGGGMGGPIDENITSQKLLIDYVRVYQRK
ncbi:MAG: family 16 glycosylhydrolase [Calditrichaceae bacterium]|nr:family 16 glycosylhydrolase [Calditrichaceae bacterium]